MSELQEVQRLLSQATYPGVLAALRRHEQSLLASPQTSQSPQSPPEDSSKNPQNTQSESAMELDDSLPTPPRVVSLKESPKAPPPIASGGKRLYTPITDFAWDQNGYDSPIVTVYIDLPGVGAVKERVSCQFTKSSFDVEVLDLDGKNYRLVKDNLDKDIEPEKSKFVVKKNKILVKLQKVKGQYSYESWTNLTSKKAPEKRNKANQDPSAGIMDMMKDMYDEGDDNMKKIIGEAMLKSKSGEKMDPPSMGM